MPAPPSNTGPIPAAQTAVSFVDPVTGIAAALDAHGYTLPGDIAAELSRVDDAAKVVKAAEQIANQPDASVDDVQGVKDAILDLNQFVGNLSELIDAATSLGVPDAVGGLSALTKMLNEMQAAINRSISATGGGGGGGGGGSGDGGTGGGDGGFSGGTTSGPTGGGATWQVPNPTNPPPADPLVLDLDGDGLELISVTASTANFDLNSDGFSERVGWVAPDDGFLVYDINSNGSVDGVGELFGNSTVDGFVPLAALDQNSDGKIDSEDPAFAKFVVWRDLDGDGTSDSGEVQSISAAEITSVSVAAARLDAQIAGNTIGNISSFTHADGSSNAVGSAYFSTNPTISVWTPPPGFTVDALAAKLPDLRGYGTTPDLRYSMTLDADLRDDVADLVLDQKTMTGAELREAFQDIVAKWTGADDVPAGSRGQYVDAKHLAVVEAIFGSDFELTRAGVVVSTNPSAINGAIVEASYDRIIDEMLLRFEVQTPVSSLLIDPAHVGEFVEGGLYALAGLGYDKATDSITGNLWTAARSLGASGPEDQADAIAHMDRMLTVLEGARWSYFEGDNEAYAAFLRSTLGSEVGWFLAEYAVAKANDMDILMGSEGPDSLSGTGEAEVILGGTGGDTLAGGANNDVYVYSRGDGADVIIEMPYNGSADEILLHGVAPSQVSFTRSGTDVTLVFAESSAGAGDGGSIRIGSLDSFVGQGLEGLTFDNGTSWSQAELRAKYLASVSTGGSDSIVGFNTDDTIAGGVGNDTLNGGAGDDVYVYARGDGIDVITEGNFNGYADKVVLHGITPGQVSISGSGANVMLVFAESSGSAGDGGSIKIGSLDDYVGQGVNQVVFDDGTIWSQATLRAMSLGATAGNDSIVGANAAETLAGLAGNDTLAGGPGDDTYIYNRGDGADVIIEGNSYGYADRILLHGVTPAQVSVTGSVNDVILAFTESSAGAADAGSIRIGKLSDYLGEGINQVVFDDGTTWNQADMRTKYLTSLSTGGADTIIGFGTADTIAGGAGNDSLDGSAGDDTYVYNRGDGADVINESNSYGYSDRLVLHGIASDQVSFTRSGSSVTLVFSESSTDAGDGGSVRIGSLENYLGEGVNQVVFDDGATWSQADLRLKYIASVSTGGSDSIVGFNSNDTINGGAGNDSLTGGAGADRFLYTSISDAPVSGTPERITDFVAGTDRIDLGGIDADSSAASDQSFSWIGANAFSNVAGQLRYETTPSGSRTIWGDTNADGQADFQIQLQGSGSLSAADFVL